jgi:TRAP-type mannitol/chloroaromatic compound transport system substrate-binding protein
MQLIAGKINEKDVFLKRRIFGMKKIYGIIVVIIAAVFMTMTIFTTAAMAETIKWRLVSVWPAYSAIFQSQTRLAKSIYELSGGRLQISVHPAGELVPSLAVFDTVSKGAAEMGVDYANYWSSKNSAFDLLGSYPLLLSQMDYLNWYYHAGGKELCNELYGKYNMLYFVNGVTPVASGIRSRTPIRSMADLKGKKIRMSGKAAGYVLQKMGAVPVMTAPTEMAQALATGTIDGASFNTMPIDWSMGLGELKYCIGPAWNQLSSSGGVIVNIDAWNTLPPDLKKIVAVAVNENNLIMTTLAAWDPINYVNKFKDKGVQNTKFSEKDLKQIEQWVWEFIVTEAEKNPDYNKIVTSMFKYLNDYREVREFEAPYSQGRNPATFPRLSGLK